MAEKFSRPGSGMDLDQNMLDDFMDDYGGNLEKPEDLYLAESKGDAVDNVETQLKFDKPQFQTIRSLEDTALPGDGVLSAHPKSTSSHGDDLELNHATSTSPAITPIASVSTEEQAKTPSYHQDAWRTVYDDTEKKEYKYITGLPLDSDALKWYHEYKFEIKDSMKGANLLLREFICVGDEHYKPLLLVVLSPKTLDKELAIIQAQNIIKGFPTSSGLHPRLVIEWGFPVFHLDEREYTPGFLPGQSLSIEGLLYSTRTAGALLELVHPNGTIYSQFITCNHVIDPDLKLNNPNAPIHPDMVPGPSTTRRAVQVNAMVQAVLGKGYDSRVRTGPRLPPIPWQGNPYRCVIPAECEFVLDLHTVDEGMEVAEIQLEKAIQRLELDPTKTSQERLDKAQQTINAYDLIYQSMRAKSRNRTTGPVSLSSGYTHGTDGSIRDWALVNAGYICGPNLIPDPRRLVPGWHLVNGLELKGFADPEECMNVCKVGKTTGLTFGRIYKKAVGVTMEDGNRESTEWYIIGDRGKDFSQQGDSGAVIVNGEGYIVGLLFGDNSTRTYFTPIMPIIREIEARTGCIVRLRCREGAFLGL